MCSPCREGKEDYAVREAFNMHVGTVDAVKCALPTVMLLLFLA